MADSTSRRKAFVAPTPEKWAEAFARVNTPEIRRLVRSVLRRKSHGRNAPALTNILLPDIARTIAAHPPMSDEEIRKFVAVSVARGVNNERRSATFRKVRFVGDVGSHDSLARARVAAHTQELTELVAAAHHQLRERQRRVLALHLAGFTPAQIGAKLNIAAPAASISVRRVIARIRALAKKDALELVTPKKKPVPARPRR